MNSARWERRLRNLLRTTKRRKPKGYARRKILFESLENRRVLSLMLMLEPGVGAPVTITDNGPGDTLPDVGIIGYTGAVQGFHVQVTTGASKPFLGGSSFAQLSTHTATVTGNAPGTLTIKVTDTDYLLSPSVGAARLTSGMGGVTSGSSSFQSYVDTNNTPFGTTGPGIVTAGLQGPFGPPVYDDTRSVMFTQNGKFSITAVSVVHVDAGEYQSIAGEAIVEALEPPTAALGDFVWGDTDGDGIQDAGEPGIANVTVELLDAGMTVIATTMTAADGSYSFTGLTPGDYFVRFVKPDGYDFTTQDAGADDGLDSDADPLTGKTTLITLSPGETDNTIDAGFRFIKFDARIDLEKYVKGEFSGDPSHGADADTPTGPVIRVGDKALFTYVVTNPGDVALQITSLIDDNATPADTTDDFQPDPVLAGIFNVGDANMDNLLDPGEVWLYRFMQTVAEGQFRNDAVVTALSTRANEDGTIDELVDSDPAHWLGVREAGGQGLTPGFWKQPHHLSFWVGYSPTDRFNTVFGVNDPDNPTLLQALRRGGGGYKALGRHAVAALLNAASQNVSYLYTRPEIISMVQSAYSTGKYDPIKNLFEAQNELGVAEPKKKK
jgi:hypothetical protein